MRGRTRRLLRKEKSSEEKTPFFSKKKSRTRENASPGFFSTTNIQARLKIGKAGDAPERQADAVADRVVKSPGGNAGVQRKSEEGETKAKLGVSRKEEEKTQKKAEVRKQDDKEKTSAKFEVQQKEEEAQKKAGIQKQEEETQKKSEIQKEEEDKTPAKLEVQRREDKASAGIEVQSFQNEKVSSKALIPRSEEEGGSITFESRLKNAKSGGDPLPDDIREEMGQKMKADFRKVRIHTNHDAIELCREIGAQAFTNGYHIFFNRGKYRPYSVSGKHLLAHELTHVVQQKM